MGFHKMLLALRRFAVVAFVLLLGAWVQAQEAGERQPILDTTLVNNEQLPSYWLGVECFPVDEALRAQLSLGEETGLLVTRVMPDSPAAKAGLQQHDVLIGASAPPELTESPAATRAAAQPVVWTPLRHQGDLAAFLRESKGGGLWLQLVRGGEEQTLLVTPAPRDAEGSPFRPDKQSLARWRQLVDQLVANQRLPVEVENELRELATRLGVQLPQLVGDANEGITGILVARPQILLESPLPDDMTVTVSKTGNQPARLVVRKGERTWEITEDKLAELPDEVREPVAKMLGSWGDVPEEARRAVRTLGRLVPTEEQFESLEQQARNEIERRLDEARQMLKEARNSPEARELLEDAEEQYEELKRHAREEGNELEREIRRMIDQRLEQVDAEIEHLKQSPALQRKVDELNRELERAQQAIEQLQKQVNEAVE